MPHQTIKIFVVFCSLKVTRDTWVDRHIYYNDCGFGKEQSDSFEEIEQLKN